MIKELTFNIIFFEEGFRAKPYYCSENFPTIGIGRRIGDKFGALPNITATLEKEKTTLSDWIERQEKIVLSHSTLRGAWLSCNDDRRAILLSMIYQLGLSGTANFKKCIAAITGKNWSEASKQMLDSRAARQTPNRFNRQAKVMLTGSIRGVYN